MRRNMAASLFEHETISTTVQKAKEVKAFAEKINKHLNYYLVDENKPSRVVLLSKSKKSAKIKE